MSIAIERKGVVRFDIDFAALPSPMPVPPEIDTITPDLGDTLGGSIVTITGTALYGVTGVTIGGSACTIVTQSTGEMEVITPAHAPSAGWDVVVTNQFGSDTLAGGFEFWDPTLISGTSVLDTSTGITRAGDAVTHWDPRGSSSMGMVQLDPAFQPVWLADAFADPRAAQSGMFGDGTSAGGAHGPLMSAAARQALPTGKTYFWVAKTLDARTTGGTPGNVPNSVISDIAPGGWSGNAGFGGQLSGGAGRVSMVNWSDDVGHFQRMTFGDAINDGAPHVCIVTHSHLSPWPAEAYVDNVRCATGSIDDVPQATPLLSRYNAATLGWNAILGGKVGNDDFFNGVIACIGVIPSVISDADRERLYKWAYGRFMRGGFSWTVVEDPTPWPAQDGAGGIELNGTLYAIAGWTQATSSRNWVFKSENHGVTWTTLLANDDNPPQSGPGARFRPRHVQPVFLHRGADAINYIEIVGGDGLDGMFPNGPGEVWRTPNGTHYERVCSDVDLLKRTLHMGGSLNGKMYVWGGQLTPSDTASAVNDTIVSEDGGVTWSTLLTTAPWEPCGIGAVLNFGGYLWMMCGGTNDTDPLNNRYFNHVARFDGSTWELMLPDGHTQFSPRKYTKGFVKSGLMWFGCGADSVGNVGGLFRSSDGLTWNTFTFLPFSARHANTWWADGTYAYEGMGAAGNEGDTRFYRMAKL